MKAIKNVLIFGAGMMGKNIAFVFSSDPTLDITVYARSDKDLYNSIRENTATRFYETEEKEEPVAQTKAVILTAEEEIGEPEIEEEPEEETLPDAEIPEEIIEEAETVEEEIKEPETEEALPAEPEILRNKAQLQAYLNT